MARQFHPSWSQEKIEEMVARHLAAIKDHTPSVEYRQNIVDAVEERSAAMDRSIVAPDESNQFTPSPGKTYCESFKPLSVRMQALDSVVTVPFLKSLVGQTKELERRVADAELRATLYRSQLLGTGRWGLWWDEVNLKLTRWLLR